jgi:hypothetical protein
MSCASPSVSKPARARDIPVAYLFKRFELRDDGRLFWKARPREHFKTLRACSVWNARFAGREAGTTTRGYIAVSIKGQKAPAHHIVFAMSNGAWPINEVDHRDGGRSNNCPLNLREANDFEQAQNQKLRADNTSGFMGVSWSTRRCKWVARIASQGRVYALGYLHTPEAAYAAYLAAKRELHTFQPEPRALGTHGEGVGQCQ